MYKVVLVVENRLCAGSGHTRNNHKHQSLLVFSTSLRGKTDASNVAFKCSLLSVVHFVFQLLEVKSLIFFNLN